MNHYADQFYNTMEASNMPLSAILQQKEQLTKAQQYRDFALEREGGVIWEYLPSSLQWKSVGIALKAYPQTSSPAFSIGISYKDFKNSEARLIRKHPEIAKFWRKAYNEFISVVKQARKAPAITNNKAYTQLRELFKKVCEINPSLDYACRILANTVDVGIFEQYPIESLEFKNKIISDKTHKEICGVYIDKPKAIEVSNKACYFTLIHELGHHLDNVYLRTDKWQKLRDKITDEFNKKKDTVAKAVDLEVKQVAEDSMIEKVVSELDNPPIPSLYSMWDDREWVAECFKLFTVNPSRLKEVAPISYNIIKKLVK